ncbi:hypothetical protein ACLBXJ_05685 [Methylobacterium mesophilicum]|jgi:hypothetical protein|uniref:hypothetical protein n=1 Tax=Methylobacterium TaxID=407 RepID=UPI0011C8FDBB|nr:MULTISPECIES: hypothetical protein [Methylobacterium]TXN43799.1 hypothetical protein FV233_17150 [Methylobacterium sp. WL7]TXN71761.1 hypothetical protein FV228_10755 [Methylobacterium sp. WL18]GJE20410.1 hypothetical protein JHFBIEKO_0838 [Methylobacterium mesophilicum]
MPDTATLWDLVTDERIATGAVGRAVDAYLAEPATRTHALGPDHVLDLAAAVAAHAFAPAKTVVIEAGAPQGRAVGPVHARPTIAMTPPTASSRSDDPTRRRRR